MNEALIELINKKKAHAAYWQRVLAALEAGYEFVDKKKTCMSYTTAGHVWSYLALALGEKNNVPFQHKVRTLLLEHDIIEPHERRGIIWMKGLIAKDPSADDAKVNTILQQHYENRKVHRQRQRADANNRYS